MPLPRPEKKKNNNEKSWYNSLNNLEKKQISNKGQKAFSMFSYVTYK